MPCFILNEDLKVLTQSAIDSLGDVDLIIIDNASPVGGGYLREVAHTYIRNQNNKGYAVAVNQGLKLCDKSEAVAVINNDIKISKGWQEVATEILEDPLVMSVHFKMIPYNQPFNLGNKTWITGKERWCTNSFFVMRNCGLFDENFLNSYDDWDIHLMMYQAGFKTAYTNKASYQHIDSSTVKLLSEREERNTKNRDYFIKKHGDTPENIWLKMFPDQMNLPYREGFE